MQRISILIADDHEVYRDGLKLMLSKQKDFELIGEVDNGLDLIQLADKLQPQVILTDIKMPYLDGIGATEKIATTNKNIGIVALSMYDDNPLILKMLEAGAKGYLQKNASKEQICQSIRTVAKGNTYYCNNTSSALATLIISSEKFNPYKKSDVVVFSDREKEVIALLCKGLATKEIAAKLFLSDRTVEGLKSKIQFKIGATNAISIVIYAFKNGLATP